MFVSRVVVVPAAGADADLRFPVAGADDQLEYAFDFSAWLSPLDRIANAPCCRMPHSRSGRWSSPLTV